MKIPPPITHTYGKRLEHKLKRCNWIRRYLTWSEIAWKVRLSGFNKRQVPAGLQTVGESERKDYQSLRGEEAFSYLSPHENRP